MLLRTKHLNRPPLTTRTHQKHQRKRTYSSNTDSKPKKSIAKKLFGAGLLLIGAFVGASVYISQKERNDMLKLRKRFENKDQGDTIQYLVPDDAPVGRDKLVILGSGWAAISLLMELGDYYDVVVVSPRNYFLFTPLLPSVTTGQLEERTVIEPIRKYLGLNSRRNVQFYEAECTDIDPENNMIFCSDTSGITGRNGDFALKYDYLVLAVGSECNTFNTPGVYENANFLKSLEDGRSLRSKIMDCFETASLPQHTSDERRRLLNFCVVGGGPTGVEFAGELNDFIQEDVLNWFPHLQNDVSITLLQSSDHILNMFDKSISEYCEKKFLSHGINVLLNTRVKEVKEDSIIMLDKTSGELKELPFGICVWSTGVTQIPVVKKFIDVLGKTSQPNKRAIIVDEFLRVKGVDNIYAIGDCSTVETKLLKKQFQNLFEKADVNGDGELSIDEISTFINSFSKVYPQLEIYRDRLIESFEEVDYDRSGSLTKDEFMKLIEYADNRVKILPATAQVASQQGKYLGKALGERARGIENTPFAYQHLGSFAFIGGETAVGEIPGLGSHGGWLVWWMWKGIYLSKQFSLKNSTMMVIDWTKAKAFGRDVSRF